MTDGAIVVTGASSGIGAATVARLRSDGYEVVAAARRADRLEELAARTGARPVVLDVTDDAAVARFAETVGPVRGLINNAGGAVGLEPIESADAADWRAMYEVNVIGTLLMTRALIPALVASGAGVIVNMGSTAGHVVYEGGAGYTAAKHALVALTETLRLELNGRPVRITEIAPGMVRTDEFALNRFRGDAERAAGVYRGVAEPLTAQDIAECVAWVLSLPPHVNIERLTVQPLAQASAYKVHRVLPD